MLSSDELIRYSRHILLPEIRQTGQENLKNSRVFVAGAGGLGSPVLTYLAAAGVGKIVFIDSDVVDLSNLQRQTLFSTSDIGKDKATCAAQRLSAINGDIEIQAIKDRLTGANILGYIKGSDLVLETSDNFPTKFLVNDACFFSGIPFITAGILRFEGQVFAVRPGETACYRCLFHSPPPAGSVPNCSDAGVLGSLAGIVGSIQATEALKILSRAGESLFGGMISINALKSEFRRIAIPRNPSCPICSGEAVIHQILDENEIVCETLPAGSRQSDVFRQQ